MSTLLNKELIKLGLTPAKVITIPKKTTIKLTTGKVYIIKLSYNALHPADNSTLLINFNHGVSPTNEYYKVEINQIMNNLVKFTGIAYDITNNIAKDKMWSGWLEKQDIEVIREC